MIFCKKCEYAIRALADLAQSRSVIGARELARRQNAPYHFVGKILQELRAQGFLSSIRGASGGFELARPADRIRLMEVVVALKCDYWLHQCIYGYADCSDHNPCPLHLGWKSIRTQIEAYLNTHTIADLVRFLAEGEQSAAEWSRQRGMQPPIS